VLHTEPEGISRKAPFEQWSSFAQRIEY
jgi:hypothetical protein